MENIIKNETIGCLQSFVGFYDSIWEPDTEIYYECERTGQEEDVDFTFDYKQYQDDICKAYTEVWEFWMQEFISEDIDLEFVEVVSPRYYNYENDSCRVKIRLTQAAEDAIIAKIGKHRNQIAKWIKENHTSYDGFSSNLSNDIDQWPSRLFDSDETYQSAYLFCMLYYIVKAEYMATGETESLEYEAYGRIREDISVTSYIKSIEKVA